MGEGIRISNVREDYGVWLSFIFYKIIIINLNTINITRRDARSDIIIHTFKYLSVTKIKMEVPTYIYQDVEF